MFQISFIAHIRWQWWLALIICTQIFLSIYFLWMQALSSYVFIAASIILHGEKTRHLDELLPPIVPLLTSHHHTLRGFTQVTLHKMDDVSYFFICGVDHGILCFIVHYVLYCRYWCIMFLRKCCLIQILIPVLLCPWKKGVLWIWDTIWYTTQIVHGKFILFFNSWSFFHWD